MQLMIEKLKAEVAALKAQLISHNITPLANFAKNSAALADDSVTGDQKPAGTSTTIS